MAIKLLVPAFGHEAGIIVRDIGYDIERRLVESNKATYDLAGGSVQSHKTVPNNVSREEQNLVESDVDMVFDQQDDDLKEEQGLTSAQREAGARSVVGVDESGVLYDQFGNVVSTGEPGPGGNGFTDNSGTVNDGIQVAIAETEVGKTCAEFIATVRNSTTNEIHSAKFLVNVESGTVLITQYADLRTALELGQFDADFSGGKLRLLFTKTTANNVSFKTSVYAH